MVINCVTTRPLMYSYNRIHNDVDNVVRVELNSSSSYRPLSSARTATLLRQQPKKTTSSINRTGTFIKHEKEKPSSIVRSETFILKHHDESPEARYADKSDYSTFTRSNKKDNFATVEKKYIVDVGDKSDYNTYTRSKKKFRFRYSWYIFYQMACVLISWDFCK